MSATQGAMQFSRGRRAAYSALTAVGFLLVLCTLSEIFLRLRWTPPSALTSPAFAVHPVWVTGPAPGASGLQVTSEYSKHFENNLLGFRGPLPDLSPEKSNPRLLILGDSQTFGLGCDNGETFSAGLRQRLEGVEVLNAGSNGYGTREDLAILHHLGPAWQPDVVVLVFFWNDIEDNVKRSVPEFAEGADGRVLRTDPVPPDFDPLALRPAVATQPTGVSGLRLPRFFKEGLRGVRYRFTGIKRRSLRTSEQMDAAWIVTAELLRLMKLRADELGCQLIVAALPDHNQVNPEAVIRGIEPLNFEVQERLFAVCEDLGVPSVDLLPALSADFEATGKSLYYYADRHLVPRGHAIVAEQLAASLLEPLGLGQ